VIIDFLAKKKEKELSKLDIIAGITVLEKTLSELSLNTSPLVKDTKLNIKRKTRELKDVYYGNEFIKKS